MKGRAGIKLDRIADVVIEGGEYSWPPSLYLETSQPLDPAPPLDGERSAHVVVIGGGYTGLSTALHLAEQGVEVVVLEARQPGWGASGRNGGQVNPGLKSEPDDIMAEFGPDLGERMVRLSQEAPQAGFDLIARYRISCEPQQTGTLRAARSKTSADVIARTAAAWSKRAMPIAYLDRQSMAASTGSDRYAAGVIDRRGGSLNPLSYARGLAMTAAKLGAAIHGNSPVRSLRRRGSKWTVETTVGEVHADWVVLATNGYSDDLWPGLKRSIVPVFSGIIASEPLGCSALRILPGRPVVYEIGSITAYYRVDRAGRLLFGGRSRQRPAGSPSEFADLKRNALGLWPFLADVRWIHGWNGQLAMTTDHYPHFHEPAPNVIAGLGYNGRGVAMATAMGREIARRVMGAGVQDLGLSVTPISTIPFHRFWRVGVWTRIAYGRLRDYFER